MNSIIDNVLSADMKKNEILKAEFDDMFRRFGPEKVVESPEIWVVDLDLPGATRRIREVLENSADEARQGRHSPLMNRPNEDPANLTPLQNKHGLYVILTDYVPEGEPNTCRFKVKELTAIYRGESDKVRDRLMGHLFQDLYQRCLRPGQVPWPSFMKLDGNNGINIDRNPYQAHTWMVVVYPLPGCGSSIRRQAELAFDRAFGKPLASTN
jgi:hypothetical protein